MKTIQLLELLANNPYLQPELQDLINSQPEEIRNAFACRNAYLLSKALSDGLPAANLTRVVLE